MRPESGPPEVADLDQLLGAIDAAPPPERAPAWPEPEFVPIQASARWGRWVAAAAALVIVGVSQITPETNSLAGLGYKGADLVAEPAPSVEMRVAWNRGDRYARLGEVEDVQIDDVLMFRLSAAPAAPIALSVQTPSGRVELAQIEAPPDGIEVEIDGQTMAYRLLEAGDYTFFAQPLDGDGAVCARPTCAMARVEVR